MFGRSKSTTEYGVRFGGKDTWGYDSKGAAEAAIRRMNKAVKKGGTQAKLIQRTVKNTAVKNKPKDTCSGGRCNKRGNVCKKHFREMTKGKSGSREWSLDDIHARWDEKGHRWG